MPATRLPIILHLSHSEIKKRYRSCMDVKERARWHVLFLVTRNDRIFTAEESADVLGYTATWACNVIHAWNQKGEAGLHDGHELFSGGRPPLLSPEEQQQLREHIQKERPPDGGLWTGPKISKWIAQKTGKKLPALGTGWNYLVRLGFSIQRPRPKHTKAASPEMQTVWKKNTRNLRGNRDLATSGKAD
jgi:transposase